jgi:hypothetical protein
MLNPVFSCPKCSKPLGDIPVAGELVVVCAQCRLKFLVVRGRVSRAHVQQVYIDLKNKAPSRYRQEHEIRLQLASGRVELVSFDLPVGEATSIARPGDVLSAVYLMRGSAREQLLSIHNATIGRSLPISFAGEKATGKAWRLGGLTGAVVVVATGMWGAPAAAALSTGAVVCIALGFGLGHRFMPRARLSPEQEAQLTSAQRMLAEKLNLEVARARTMRELEARRALQERLLSLRTKMVNVGLDAYRPRIATLDRALENIEQQMALEARLRAGYERSIQMIEIELEAGAAADALDASAAPHIAQTLQEMHELEEQQAELGRQLAANIEVEELLRSSEQ